MTRLIFLLLTATVLCLPTTVSAQWYAGFDLIVPTRRDSSNTVFARNQVTQDVLDAEGNPTFDENGDRITITVVGEDVLASAQSLEVDFELGGRLTLGRRFGTYGIEGTYLETKPFTKSQSLTDSDGLLASPFSPVGVEIDPVLDNNTAIDLLLETKMETAEINLFRLAEARPTGEAFFLFGVRYMAVDDTLFFAATNDLGIDVRRIATNNVLIGPQIGLVTHSPLKRGFMHIRLKASATYNRFDKVTAIGGGAPVSATGDNNRASAIGEFGIAYECSPINFTSIRIGYDLIAASDMALAVENFDTGPAIVTDGVVYHVPYIGLVMKY